MRESVYVGKELSIFANATNWKKYFSSIIRPFLGKYVVEVGAGLAATTRILCDGTQDTWVCLEPDHNQYLEIYHLIQDLKLPKCCQAREGFITSLNNMEPIDTIVYIDVLEHIENDNNELAEAAQYLKPGGVLIILSPAFNFLCSPFDKSIGHYRRYTKSMIRDLTPPGCRLEKKLYTDSLGVITSLANRFVLRQAMPTVEQIMFWDNYIVPITRYIDRLINFSFGRSIIGIWRRI